MISRTASLLPVSVRRDLLVSQTSKTSWTIKDPLSGQFTLLREHDYFVFQQLREPNSIEGIQQRFFQIYAPHRLSEMTVVSFIQRLWAIGLLHVEKHGASTSLVHRSAKIQKAEFWQRFTNVLAIRFRGFDPDRFLDRFLPFVRWVYHPTTLIFGGLLICLSFVLAASNFDAIYLELPRVGSFLTSPNLIWLLCVIATTKIVHELAHGFTCKYFGGECHEMGMMLLALTPCLYCDVSDSWRLSNRWQRIAISMAGIYVELLLAAVCMVLWLWTEPGLVHTICLYVAVFGSINTFFLNGNPLLRYDGYYVLSDLVGLPNLRSRAQAVVRDFASRMVFGVSIPKPFQYSAMTQVLLAVYGLCSALYLWFVLLAIFWMLYQILRPWGMHAFVVLLAVLTIGARILVAVRSLAVFSSALLSRGELPKHRLAVGAVVTVAIVSLILLAPVPRRIKAPCLIVSGRNTPIHVSTPGRLDHVEVDDGERVQPGDPIARLVNRDLEIEQLRRQAHVDRQVKTVELLEQRQVYDPAASASLPSARARLEDLRQQLVEATAQLKRLVVTTPVPGVISEGEFRTRAKPAESSFLADESPLDPLNRGGWLESESVLCRVVDESQRHAIVYVQQSEVVFVQIGSKVIVTTNQHAERPLTGVVIDISTSPISIVPESMAAEKFIPYRPSLESARTPDTPTYEVRVQLASESDLILNQIAWARISLPSETLFFKLKRKLAQTFRFDLPR